MNLYKINDVLDTEFIRFPLSLLAGKNYKPMSLEAKVVYSLLLNRLTLSQRNGWLNEQNEVYLIYTREEAADTLGITYKKAIAAFKELLSYGLIIEKRRGRGFPNIIYLVKIELSVEDAKTFKQGFDGCKSEEPETPEIPLSALACKNSSSRPADMAHQDLPISHIKSCQSGSSRPVNLAVQDMPKPHTSKIENNHIDFSQIEFSQSVGQRGPAAKTTRGRLPPEDGQTGGLADAKMIDRIFENCEPHIFNETAQVMFRTAIERLYYSDRLKIGNAVLPREKVRNYLHLLDADTLIATYEKLKANEETVKNPMAYMMSVMFNCICEREGETLMNLPPEYVKAGDYFASD